LPAPGDAVEFEQAAIPAPAEGFFMGVQLVAQRPLGAEVTEDCGEGLLGGMDRQRAGEAGRLR